LLLKALGRKKMRIADPLAATGVRGIRFLLELPKAMVQTVCFNDNDKEFKKNIAGNLKLNKIGKARVSVSNKDANLFLLNSSGFDYIDIDPFGTPNPFLDAAVRRIGRGGIIAVTATDTSALCGAFPAACIRKYWAVPVNNEQMYEFGLRILIRKVQLIGSQYGKALLPLFSYTKDHYMRVFFRSEKAKSAADEILNQHRMFGRAGPAWHGSLWDAKLVSAMLKLAKDRETVKFLRLIKDESLVGAVGYYDLHTIFAGKKIPQKQDLIALLRRKGYLASETHFLGTAVRSNASLEELKRIIKQ
jgi:tRNA (guanine26-N2/guanine27-N2)-dimethyltransferase